MANGTYTGTEKRENGRDRRDHVCLHEGDFGELKANVKNLNDKFEDTVKDQKERNMVVDNKFDRITSCLTQVSAAQETLPGKVVSLLEDKKDKKLKNQSTVLRNISTILGILAVIGTALYWVFNFVNANAVPLP
jgi:hypothetical protein